MPGFAVIDVETTGFSATNDRIVELAVVVLDENGIELESFCTLLNPLRSVGPTHVHGITDEMVANAPEFKSVQGHVADLLSGRVIVGHNVKRFDIGFVVAECGRTNLAAESFGVPPSIDTMLVARDLLDMYGRATLVDCCNHFGLSWSDHHSALGDARITSELFNAMRSQLGDAVLDVPTRLEEARHFIWPGSGQRSTRPVVHVR